MRGRATQGRAYGGPNVRVLVQILARDLSNGAEFVFASGWPHLAARSRSSPPPRSSSASRLVRRKLGLERRSQLRDVRRDCRRLLVAALLVLAWRPALVTQTLRPQENSVAVLARHVGQHAVRRRASASRLQEADRRLVGRARCRLSKSTFDVNLFSFAGELVELPSLQQVRRRGPHAPRRCALNVLRGAQSGAIAAVVLVTDGADNSADFDAAKIAEIASFGVPVHTVLGAETMPNDLELEDVQLPSVGLPGSTVSAQISIPQRRDARAAQGYDGEAILASEAIQLPATTGVTTRWVTSSSARPACAT